MKDNYWDFGDIRITKRELLASITIVAIMFILGFMIAGKISDWQMDKNAEYYKAAKITDSEMFQYGMDTNVGNAFVYGDLKAVDTVTYPEIGGEYMSVKKVKERYTRHTKRVKSGKTWHTKVYWTWDAVDGWSEHCNKVTFLGIEFDYEQIYKPSEHHIVTQKESSHIRYVYYGSDTKYTGTIFSNLKDKTINSTEFYNGKNIEETVKYLESGAGVVIFWIFWMLLTGGCVFGFYYIDNKWLE